MKKLFLFALIEVSSMISIYAQRVVVDHDHFLSIYNVKTLCPEVVEWTLKRSDFGEVKRSPSWRFRDDVSHPLGVATHDDYSFSGYDRGHMCPAADRSSSGELMLSTFVTSNIAPQAPRLNRGTWLDTEIFCRKATMIYDSLRVMAMPIFMHRDTARIGAHGVAVPHAFLKVAYIPGNDSIIHVWFLFNK